jgi:hypothetical protein
VAFGELVWCTRVLALSRSFNSSEVTVLKSGFPRRALQ